MFSNLAVAVAIVVFFNSLMTYFGSVINQDKSGKISQEKITDSHFWIF